LPSRRDKKRRHLDIEDLDVGAMATKVARVKVEENENDIIDLTGDSDSD
jgi:hypothetical protein